MEKYRLSSDVEVLLGFAGVRFPSRHFFRPRRAHVKLKPGLSFEPA
jgi:hypothetical protein